MQTEGKAGQGECSHIFLLSSYSINYLQRLPDFSLVTHQNCNGIVKALIPSFSQVAQRQNNFMLHSYLHVVNLTWLCLNHFHYQANLKLINLLKVKLSPYKKLFYLFQWKSVKNNEKCFYFHLKSSFRFYDIYIFVLTFRSCRKNNLIRNIRLISKFMMSKPG